MDEMRVLLVDGDEAFRKDLSAAIQARGMKTIEAATGGEALLVAWRGQVDLVIADLRIPQGKSLGMLNMSKSLQPTVPFFVIVKGSGGFSGVDCDIADEIFHYPCDPDEIAAAALLACRAHHSSRGAPN